jgi:tRNA dimethylallyltransferase
LLLLAIISRLEGAFELGLGQKKGESIASKCSKSLSSQITSMITSVPEPKTIVVVLGPTGSGKSDLALALAQDWQGEIVNCDSVQVYTGFDIGSAKLPIIRRNGIPHHLIDVAGPGENFTAGEYSRQARRALDEISGRSHLPIVCGGTGFYLRALLAGLSPAPKRCDSLRARLSKLARRRPRSLYRLLERSDRSTALRIHPNDHQKLIRALEIAYLERMTAAEVQARPRNSLEGYRFLKLGLDPDRSLLYCRLNARAEKIFSRGLIEETRMLLGRGYEPASSPMQSLGYRQALAVISGSATPESAIRDCQLRTRQYAKRQMTWFRAESDVHWLYGFGNEPAIVREASSRVAQFQATS